MNLISNILFRIWKLKAQASRILHLLLKVSPNNLKEKPGKETVDFGSL